VPSFTSKKYSSSIARWVRAFFFLGGTASWRRTAVMNSASGSAVVGAAAPLSGSCWIMVPPTFYKVNHTTVARKKATRHHSYEPNG
jgi:hypothetical protein